MIDMRKRYQIMVKETDRIDLHLIGCGGTGSFLALHLARLSYDARRDGLEIRLIFHDGDIIEEKNIGRQNFAPAEVGDHKALALARRYSLAFGMDIQAVPEMFSAASPHVENHSDLVTVIVGAVDTPAGRREIAELATLRRNTWWLDCGNHEHAGQVLLGNTEIKKPSISPLGFCDWLPLPSCVAPDLLEDPGSAPLADDGDPLSCAELVALGAQSLMINQAIAGWAAVMLGRLLVGRDLDFWQVWVDLHSGTSRSVGVYEC